MDDEKDKDELEIRPKETRESEMLLSTIEKFLRKVCSMFNVEKHS